MLISLTWHCPKQVCSPPPCCRMLLKLKAAWRHCISHPRPSGHRYPLCPGIYRHSITLRYLNGTRSCAVRQPKLRLRKPVFSLLSVTAGLTRHWGCMAVRKTMTLWSG